MITIRPAAPGQTGLSIIQPPGMPQPGEQTRVQLAGLRASSAALEELSAKANVGAQTLFGYKNAAEAFGARTKEQLGIGMSRPEYEKFWADMEFQKASTIRALEKGNVSESDIKFFLAGFPEKADPPTVGVITTQASHQFVKERQEAIEAEFSKTPTADPKEVAARVSNQLAGKRAQAIRSLESQMQAGEIKTQSQALQHLQSQGLSKAEAMLVVLSIPKKKK